MKYVDFFGHKVSKLICGDNPFNGHSYITHLIPGAEMKNYHTEAKIIDAMHQMEELGINTMLPLADPYIIRILQHYRADGGKMNFIFQTFAPFMTSYDNAKMSVWQMMSVNPIGLYLSGTYTDVRFETERNHEIIGMMNLLRNMCGPENIKVGFGSHRPELIELCEKENWGAEFYMACMYNLRRNREGQDSGFITGKSKSDIKAIIPGDRAIMLDTLKGIDKPIIAFKIFAGGQMLAEKEEAERKVLIKDTYDTIFTSLKPNDFATMGIFQKNHDQLTENVVAFNEWAEEKGI